MRRSEWGECDVFIESARWNESEENPRPIAVSRAVNGGRELVSCTQREIQTNKGVAGTNTRMPAGG